MSHIQWGVVWGDSDGFVETYGTRDAAEQGLASVQGVWDSYNSCTWHAGATDCGGGVMSNIHVTTDSEYEYRWGVGCTWGVEWAEDEDQARRWYAEDQEVGYDSLLVKQFLGSIEAVQ